MDLTEQVKCAVGHALYDHGHESLSQNDLIAEHIVCNLIRMGLLPAAPSPTSPPESSKEIISDEIVEKAARALLVKFCRHMGHADSAVEFMWKHDRKDYEDQARAALTAVLPDLIEEIKRKPETCADARCASYAAAVEKCAQVADDEAEKIKDAIGAARRDGAFDWANEAVGRGLAVEAVATRIRARKE